jgi:hypothetical protein
MPCGLYDEQAFSYVSESGCVSVSIISITLE